MSTLNSTAGTIDIPLLIEKAIEARNFSYSPYSNFQVGACLLAANAELFTGCNIESASYTPTICAERAAFTNAVSKGNHQFKAIAIVGGKQGTDELPLCAPCGVCRQVMAEFCNTKEFIIIMAKTKDNYIIKTLDELLPLSFGGDIL